MADYTPTTEEVREAWMAERYERHDIYGSQSRDEFNRWLASVLAEQGEPEWEFAWELRESDTGDFFDRGGPQLNEAQAVALGVLRAAAENRATPNEPPLHVHVVRRRKAGHWLPVEENGEHA